MFRTSKVRKTNHEIDNNMNDDSKNTRSQQNDCEKNIKKVSKCQINPKTTPTTVSPNKMPDITEDEIFETVDNKKYDHFPICLKIKVTIPPRSEVIFVEKIDGTVNANREWIVEPSTMKKR